MQSNRCRHYHLETEFIAVPGAPVMLRIPIRRCYLAEHMIERLSTTDQGVDVARKLMFSFTLTSTPHVDDQTEPPPTNIPIRAIFGPDLEPIHHEDCLGQRCLTSCTPGYVALLEQFGMAADADHAIGKGCQETTELTEDAR